MSVHPSPPVCLPVSSGVPQASVNCPVLIVHGRDDEIIPFSHGWRLFEVANEPKRFLEIAGTHNEGFIMSGKGYEEGLNTIISKYIAPKI